MEESGAQFSSGMRARLSGPEHQWRFADLFPLWAWLALRRAPGVAGKLAGWQAGRQASWQADTHATLTIAYRLPAVALRALPWL